MMRPPSGWLGRAPSDRESYIPYNYSYQTSPHARYPPFCSTCCCDGFFAGRGDGVFSDRVGLFTGDVVTSSGLFIRVPSSGAPSVSSQIRPHASTVIPPSASQSLALVRPSASPMPPCVFHVDSVSFDCPWHAGISGPPATAADVVLCLQRGKALLAQLSLAPRVL